MSEGDNFVNFFIMPGSQLQTQASAFNAKSSKSQSAVAARHSFLIFFIVQRKEAVAEQRKPETQEQFSLPMDKAFQPIFSWSSLLRKQLQSNKAVPRQSGGAH